MVPHPGSLVDHLGRREENTRAGLSPETVVNTSGWDPGRMGLKTSLCDPDMQPRLRNTGLDAP